MGVGFVQSIFGTGRRLSFTLNCGHFNQTVNWISAYRWKMQYALLVTQKGISIETFFDLELFL